MNLGRKIEIKTQYLRHWIIIFLFCFVQLNSFSQTNFIDSVLTKDEINWLKNNKDKIIYAPNSFWPPGDFIDENGVHKGVVADYINIFEKKLEITFKREIFNSWTDILDGLKNKKVDFVGAVHKSVEREQYLIFTESFLSVPLVIITRDDYSKELSKNQINKMKLACASGYTSINYINQTYPDAEVIECKDDLTALLKTSSGITDGTVVDMMVASYIVERYGIVNLGLALQLDFSWQLRFGVRKDYTELCSILNKTLKSISIEERKLIRDKWISLGDVRPKTFIERNLKFILFSSALLLLLFILVLGFNIILRRLVKIKTRDIKTANEALEASEKKFRKLFENSPVGISITSVDGSIYVNSTFSKMLGYSENELNKEKWQDISHPDDVQYSNEIAQSIIIGESQKARFEKRYIHKNGNILWADVSTYLQRDKNNKPLFFITAINDITLRRAAEAELFEAKEKAEESSRLKTAFLANLSHEIRTPMNAILGFTDLLKKPDLSSEKRNDFINIIHKSGNYLLSVITDIVEVSKLDTRQVFLSFSEFEINNFTRVIYESMLINLPKEKNIEFVIEKSNIAENTIISTDDVKLKQIIFNLITNAFKYTIEGNVMFKYNLSVNSELEIIVQDTGIGISEKYHEIIFERFRQVEIENKIFQQGSGLGLSICKAYTEMLGGTIIVESEPDKGSSFIVSIPVIIVNNGAIKEESSSVSNIHSEIIKILIAEDDEINYLYLTEILPYSNFILYHANNGMEAIKMFKEIEGINLILMDIKMPVMNGYETLKEIRKIDLKIPVIAQTAHALSEDNRNIKSAGFDGYISKPINKEKLIEIIEKTKK